MASGLIWLVVVVAVGLLAGLGVLARRDPHLARISRRHLKRRPARALIIIFGLLLATVLIVTATVVSDTLTLAVQREAVARVGRVDEAISGGTGGLGVFPADVGAQVQAHLAGDKRVSGIASALLVPEMLVVDETAQQVHSAINLLGMDANRHDGPLGAWHLTSGQPVGLSDLQTDEAYLNSSTADLLHAAKGDRIAIYSVHWSGQAVQVKVRGIIDAGPLGTQPTVVVPLLQLQSIANAESEINRVFIANAGDGLSGVGYSAAIACAVRPALPQGLGLRVQLVKQNAVNLAVQAETLFGHILGLYTLFALAVEALLIFLVFALLAAERRGEMAMLRALGLHRREVVEVLLFEAAIYNLAAVVPGALLGLGLGFLLVVVIAPAVAHLGISLQLGFEPAGFFAALSAGVLFTLIITTVAIWQVSGMTVAAALRDMPDPPAPSPALRDLVQRARAARSGPAQVRAWSMLAWGIGWRGFIPAAAGFVVLAATWGRGGLGPALGLGLLVAGIVLLARWGWLRRRGAEIQTLPEGTRLLALHQVRLRADRASAFAVGALALAYWAAPSRWLGAWRFSGGISTFFIAGMLMVLGVVLALTPNLDLLLRPLQRWLARRGRFRHVTTIGLIYPAYQRFRTGIGVALFGLVCFVMVVMSCIATSTSQRYSDIGVLTGGYDILGQPLSKSISSIDALRATLRDRAPQAARQIQQISAASALPLAMIQPDGTNAGWRLYPAAQIDGAFLQGTGLPLTARAQGFASDGDVWHAVQTQPGDVVIDAAALDPNEAAALGIQQPPLPDLTDFAAPPIAATLLGPAPLEAALSQPATQDLLRKTTPDERDLLQDPAKLHHFTLQLTNTGVRNGTFAPITLWVGDFRSATPVRQVTVVGIVDNVQGQRYGLLGSAATFASIEAGLAPVGNPYYYFQLAPGANAANVARSIGAALLGNGFETTVVRATLLTQNAPAIFASQVLLRLVALMLLVGVAALMITGLRAVVERRQQIGMLRALGFHRADVQAVFIIESLLVAVGGALMGLGIGLVLCRNAFAITFLDEAHLGLALVVPWGSLAVILLSAVVCALAAVIVPARQAGSVAPAEALRYE
jgi:putative ABC transport system permease protein